MARTAPVKWFNRDKGIKNGKDFYFTETITGGGAKLVLKQRLRGKLVNSHLWQSIEKQGWFDDRKTRSISWWGGSARVMREPLPPSSESGGRGGVG